MSHVHLNRAQREYVDALDPSADSWTPDGYDFLAVRSTQAVAYDELRRTDLARGTSWVGMSEHDRESIRPRRLRLAPETPRTTTTVHDAPEAVSA